MNFFTLENLILAVGWLLVLLIGLLGLAILWLILRGKIDLSMLVSEADGKASLARFQCLIFTFVFAMSLVLVILSQSPPAFPTEIPLSALALLGISTASYLTSKGIQNARDGNPTIATTSQVRYEALRALSTPQAASTAQTLKEAAGVLASANVSDNARTVIQAADKLSSIDLADSARRLDDAAQMMARSSGRAVPKT